MNPKELIEYDGPDRIVHFSEYLKTKASEKYSLGNFRSGFEKFDDKLDGLCTSEVTVISGKTGEGKTTFAESWMHGLLTRNPDLKACFFSFEVPPKNLLNKYAHNDKLSIYLPLQLESSNFTWLYERTWEAAVKHNCKLFVFDHLHFLIDMAEKQNMSLNIGKLMRQLKSKIAMELNVAVVLIAHQSQTGQAQSGKPDDPSLEKIRDSSFIAQEADNVVILWRRPNFTAKELSDIDVENPMAASAIRSRINKSMAPRDDNYFDQFCVVQIAKGRRNGAFRWKKLFQKVGDWIEEV